MKRKWLAVPIVFLFVVSLAGCVTDSGYYDPARSAGAGALGGAAAGAALGASIGAASGHAATGAWIGAAAGGVLGGVRAALMPLTATRDSFGSATAPAAYGYQGQGNVVSVSDVRLLRRGQSRAANHAEYGLHHPDPGQYAGVRHPGAGGPVPRGAWWGRPSKPRSPADRDGGCN